MLAKIAFWILNLFGWKLVGQLPKLNKYVIIIAPHTSNWDFFIFILVKMHYRLDVVFIGKHTIFIGPIGWVLRKLGGLPVNRNSSHKVVDQIVDEFKLRQQMVFGLSPEGTRSYLDHWKSGFYHIAIKAKVPVQTAFLDIDTRTLGWGPLFHLSGDKEKDLDLIAEFYTNKKGIKSEKFSKIVFKKNN